LALDPQSVDAQGRLAEALVMRVLNQMTDSAASDSERAEGLAAQALAALPRSGYAHRVKGELLRAQNRWQEAIHEYETALTLDRNLVSALNGLAQCKLLAGSIEEVIPLEEEVIRLSPRDANIGFRYTVIGTVHLLESRIDEAILWLERARSGVPAVSHVRSRLAAAYALNGETDRAVFELAEARRLSGGMYSSIASVKAEGRWLGVPKVRALYEATYFTGLRLAGVPEE
jgi:tetratricopeptide (TPR) repeat protein